MEPDKIKYFACGEYGDTTLRPHYHAVIFGVRSQVELFEKFWKDGFVYAGSVTPYSIGYVTGYVTKKLNGKKAKEVYGNREAPFQLQSQKLGAQWLKDNEDQVKDNLGVTMFGTNVGLPRYYKKQLEEEIGDRLIEKAIDSEEKLKCKIAEIRGTDDELVFLQVQSAMRKQTERNIIASTSLRKKGSL
jgi:hypothetical protein